MPRHLKILLLATFLILNSSFIINSQNLVPNPSFEEYDTCPDTAANISYSNGWFSYMGTPDYFNTCSSNNDYSIPNNGWGFQNTLICNGYVGLWAYYSFSPNGREYIGRKMYSTMIIGQKYFISFKVSLAEISNCGINNLGIMFSTVPYSQGNTVLINNTPNFYTSTIIIDTTNWVTISGSFIADSAYQYIVIGNFFDDTNTDTIKIGIEQFFGFGAYYFIDDVCVSIDSADCNPFTPVCNNNINNINNVHICICPNPAKTIIKIETNRKLLNKLTIYNIYGTKIKTIYLRKATSYVNIHNFQNGVYIFRLETKNKTITKKIIINH